MLPSWRLQLGEARRALRSGQLDRACAIVGQDDLKEFRQARELSAELASQIAERARDRMAAGFSSAGCSDLRLAERMAGNDRLVADIRDDYRQQVVDRVARYLTNGRTAAALQELSKLQRRHLSDVSVDHLQSLVQQVAQAEQLLACGKSSEASQVLRHQHTEPDVLSGTMISTAVNNRTEQLLDECQSHSQLTRQLHSATSESDWHQVLGVADKLLTLAPRDRVAIAARRQAWRAVGLDATQVYHAAGRPVASMAVGDTSVAARPSATCSPDDTMSAQQPANRFMMWIDSVGGFLVCLDSEVVLGQPTPGSNIAVPISADLSRRHAIIRREGGNYTIEPLGEVAVDGRQLTGPKVLGSQHTIELGDTVKLEFSKPHALSATARLTPTSGHRTQPRADAVLLMADSCVLGPRPHSHVLCRRWPGDVMLFRQEGRLCCRSNLSLTIDGVVADGVTPVESGARLEGEEFAISLEDV